MTGKALRLALPIGRRVEELSAGELNRLFDRRPAFDDEIGDKVAQIIVNVCAHGDEALRAITAQFDRVDLGPIEVPQPCLQRALDALTPALRAALQESADAIRAFHSAQLPQTMEIEVRRGVRLGRRSEPLHRVGVYAPGGRATYPSSVLMGAVPARVAGVSEVALCSPPGPDGFPSPLVLAAAAIAGVDHVYAVGGPAAIAALACGTETIPRVDKIVGPGNAYVTEAKRQLTGITATDCPAGPSEVLILADETADPDVAAAELIAQTEHDPDAAAVLVGTDEATLGRVAAAVMKAAAATARREIVMASLAANGALLLARDVPAMIDFAARYAPEHLLVLTRDPRALLGQSRHAGSIFLGKNSSVVFGDYMTGANHVLPTGGLARAFAGLSAADFRREYTYQEVDAAAARKLAPPTAILADAEGLPAHAAAARLRATAAAAAASEDPGPVLRDAYLSITLYDPQRCPCAVDLSDNTNLFGAPPSSRRVLADLTGESLTRYPCVFASVLKDAIAAWHGVAPENVATGCGSDDVIDSALRAFCERADRVVFPDPTFSMVAGFARMNALKPVPVPLTDQLGLDVDALCAARGRVTYVCSPNNPTGTVFSRGHIETLAAEVPGVLLLDEAYADFAGEDYATFAVASSRVVSLRTFSKAFGLAGLRIGYALGPTALIHEIEKSRGPYKVSRIAELVATAALREDGDWVRRQIAQVRENRSRLRAALQDIGYRSFPSGGNFLLVQTRGPQTADDLAVTLRERGVAVRPFGGLPQLGDCVRVTIGPWPLIEKFLAELPHI